MYNMPTGAPQQKLPTSQKNKKWRKSNVDWADMSSMMYDNAVRQSLRHKKINYDLFDGKLHLSDMKQVLNPYAIDSDAFIPDNVQYYSILNSPINALIGEEAKRRFEFRAVVSNYNAISEKEKAKKAELDAVMMELIKNDSQSEEDFQKKMKEHGQYFAYEWQDTRERSANFILSHHILEPLIP